MVLKEKVKDANVLFVDGLIHNLLSVSQIYDEGHEVIFRSNNYVVRNLDIDKTIIKGTKTLGNVYILDVRN